MNSSFFHTVTHSVLWKNEKFGLTEKIFRQINSLVVCLEKPLLSRNFCRKSVEKRKIWSHQKIFRQINYLVISLVKALLSRNFCQNVWDLLQQFAGWESSAHTVDFTKFLYHDFLKNFRENNFFSEEFSIWLISWNNFQVIQKFSKLHSVALEIPKIYSFNFWKCISSQIYMKSTNSMYLLLNYNDSRFHGIFQDATLWKLQESTFWKKFVK